MLKRYLFAKFFRHLSVDELMEKTAQAGLDGPTALIRNGYWIDQQNMSRELPRFVRAAMLQGLEVKFGSTGFAMEDLIKDDTPMRIMADNGIECFRLGYVPRQESDPRELAATVRALAEKTACAAERCGIKAVMQLHASNYPHSATAAWPLVKDLPAEYFGVMIDPGNNCIEGFEFFEYQVNLLGRYIQAMGVKDALVRRNLNPEKCTVRESQWVPVDEGLNDWGEILRLLETVGFNGPLILMPFYDASNFPLLYEKLCREVKYIDAALKLLNQKK